MHKRLLIVALAAIPLVSAAADQRAVDKAEASTRTAAAPRVSQDKLDRIRQSLVAQIAAWEQAEGAMRAPTSDEMAALAMLSSEGRDAVVPVAGGGVALRPDISHASLAIAVRGEDGKVAIGHEAPSKGGTGNAKKGAAHVH
jgi:hypothetical protein